MTYRIKLAVLSLWWRFKHWWSPPPSFAYVDEGGVGWAQSPDYREAWQEDVGQNDVFKRLLWEAVQGAPVSMDLAAACQRLGFLNLARSIEMSDEEAARWWLAKSATIEEDARRQLAFIAERGVGAMPTLDELLTVYGLGPFEGAPLPEGKVRQPLKVLPLAERARRVGSWADLNRG